MKHIQKIAFSVLMYLAPSLNGSAQNFYDLPLKDINNASVELQSLKGRKIMVIVLPAVEKDTALLSQLMSFERKYKDAIQIIGIPSYEDGYKDENKSMLLASKDKKGSSMIITEASNTREGSGTRQSSLSRWLTDKEQNKHFAEGIKGAGHKFFIDEKGELYAVLGPGLPLTSPHMEKIVNRQLK